MKTLRRSLSDRVLLGVCGGIGEYFGVSGDLVRVIWIFLFLLGGIGVIPYIAAVLLMPESDSAPVSEPGSRLAKNVGLALILVGGWILAHQIGRGPFGMGSFVVWPWKTVIPLLIVGAGAVFIWPQSRDVLGLSSERKIRRSVSNRILAGVCGGIAERAGVDANLVRLAFVFATVVSTGVAALAYLVLIVLLREEEVAGAAGAPSGPSEPASSPPAASPSSGASPPPPPAASPSSHASPPPQSADPAGDPSETEPGDEPGQGDPASDR